MAFNPKLINDLRFLFNSMSHDELMAALEALVENVDDETLVEIFGADLDDCLNSWD